jgi:hypothetical protein
MKPAPEPDRADQGQDPATQGATGQNLALSDAQHYRWYHKLLGLLAVIFCFELGVFLLVFPWASDWDLNYFSSLPLWAANIWASPYFRGAISGIGVLNIYVSFVEVFRLRRFSAPPSSLG